METSSLEEDVLALFWESEKPLTLKSAHQRLKDKNIIVPVKTVQNILGIFENAGLIESKFGFGWSKHYTALVTEKELEFSSSEHLLVRCLTAKHTVIKKQFHVNIIEKITHLQWFSGDAEE
jgi:Fe2+ or Zn2+ uptake regulation protein